MTIGTDTLATLTFPGTNGAAIPAEWTAQLGTWSQNGSSGVTYTNGGVTGLKAIYTDPTRANDNYSLSISGATQGGTDDGVILRWTAGTGTTSNGYYITQSGGSVKLYKITNSTLGSALATITPSNQNNWMAAATFTAETVSGDVVITASSTGGGSQSFTYTDVAANSPYLTGKIALAAQSTSTASSWTGPLTINGTAAATGPTLSAGSPANGSTVGPSTTISCTTDTAPSTTTARIIIDTAAHITGGTPVTAAQVLAGNCNTGSAALYDSGNITTGTTTISKAFTGLAAGSYTWAIAQGTATVLTGTLTVAQATITSITGSAADTVKQGSSFTIAGTNYGASQGAGTVTIGGASCTVTSWGATSITATAPSGIMFTGTKTVTVTPDTATATAGSRASITYLPPTSYIFEAITAVPVSADSLAYGVSGLAVGDEVWCNSAASPSGTVVFNGTGAGTVSITGVTVDGDYTISGIQVRDATDGSDTTNGPKTVTYFTGGTATGKTVRRMRHGFGLSF